MHGFCKAVFVAGTEWNLAPKFKCFEVEHTTRTDADGCERDEEKEKKGPPELQTPSTTLYHTYMRWLELTYSSMMLLSFPVKKAQLQNNLHTLTSSSCCCCRICSFLKRECVHKCLTSPGWLFWQLCSKWNKSLWLRLSTMANQSKQCEILCWQPPTKWSQSIIFVLGTVVWRSIWPYSFDLNIKVSVKRECVHKCLTLW